MRNFFVVTLIIVLIALATRNTAPTKAAIAWLTSIWSKALGALTTGKVS